MNNIHKAALCARVIEMDTKDISDTKTRENAVGTDRSVVDAATGRISEVAVALYAQLPVFSLVLDYRLWAGAVTSHSLVSEFLWQL